jgi:hypothetical protein
VALVKKKREVHKKEKRKRKTEKERAKKEKAKRRREWAKREGKISAVHRASWLVRAAILACISLLSVGSYFAYDSIAALETYIKQDLDLNSFRFGFLYSSYAIPNIGTPHTRTRTCTYTTAHAPPHTAHAHASLD